MDFKEYQDKAKTTAIYPEQFKVNYPILGLSGEAGELANKYKKVLRDDNGVLKDEKRQQLVDEIGDCLWYISAIASDLGVDLDKIATGNIEKLFSRKERGQIKGSGDNR